MEHFSKYESFGCPVLDSVFCSVIQELKTTYLCIINLLLCLFHK
jgi:hypothetical protein